MLPYIDRIQSFFFTEKMAVFPPEFSSISILLIFIP